MSAVAKVLRDAAALIEPEGAWCQHFAARNSNGKGATPNSSQAVQWCALGSLERVATNSDYYAAEEALERHLGLVTGDDEEPLVGVWNDAKGRTQAEVVAALRAAADALEAKP